MSKYTKEIPFFPVCIFQKALKNFRALVGSKLSHFSDSFFVNKNGLILGTKGDMLAYNQELIPYH